MKTSHTLPLTKKTSIPIHLKWELDCWPEWSDLERRKFGPPSPSDVEEILKRFQETAKNCKIRAYLAHSTDTDTPADWYGWDTSPEAITWRGKTLPPIQVISNHWLGFYLQPQRGTSIPPTFNQLFAAHIDPDLRALPWATIRQDITRETIREALKKLQTISAEYITAWTSIQSQATEKARTA